MSRNMFGYLYEVSGVISVQRMMPFLDPLSMQTTYAHTERCLSLLYLCMHMQVSLFDEELVKKRLLSSSSEESCKDVLVISG